MSAAGRLREAAALLRERAEAATPGPWDHVVGASGHSAWVELRHVETIAGSTSVATCAYIAMMHPPVALALADWLDAEAATATPRGLDPHTGPTAVAVADAILGGDR